MYRCALAALAAVCIVTPAAAQQRGFPKNALRGTLNVGSPAEAMLNGQGVRLAPGVRIRGPNNLLQPAGAVIGSNLLVHYTTDPFGFVNEIWVLTPEEAAKRPWPTTQAEAAAWEFDPLTQTWTKP